MTILEPGKARQATKASPDSHRNEKVCCLLSDDGTTAWSGNLPLRLPLMPALIDLSGKQASPEIA